jgi:hypothetical protein
MRYAMRTLPGQYENDPVSVLQIRDRNVARLWEIPHTGTNESTNPANSGRAWAAFGRPLEMLTQDVCTLYNAHTVYNSYGGVVLANQEGERIATALAGHNKAAILLNHGLLTVGETVDEASFLFGLLERSCDIQLRIEAACRSSTSLTKRLISDEEAAYNFRVAHEPNVLFREAQPDIELEIEAAGGEHKLAKGVYHLGHLKESKALPQ